MTWVISCPPSPAKTGIATGIGLKTPSVKLTRNSAEALEVIPINIMRTSIIFFMQRQPFSDYLVNAV